MILFFSGTGNSHYVAKLISMVTGDEITSINEMLKNESKQVLKSDQPFIFVCPVYAWRIPRIVDTFIKNANFEGSNKAYFVLTCGDGTGNAVHYAKRTCLEKNLHFMGLASVLMPENYIAMFDVPDEVQAKAIIEKADDHILAIAKLIKSSQLLPLEVGRLGDRLKSSSIVNATFYKAIVSAKGFYSTDACVACERCAALCALNNITMKENKPKWGSNCTHCMACICGCPKEAVEYKDKSKGKPRYYNKQEAFFENR